MGFTEFKAPSVDDAITEASLNLGVPSTELVYEIVEEGSNGFLGIGKKPAIIKARVRQDGEEAGLIKKEADKPKFTMEVKDDQVKVDTFDDNKTTINKKPEKKPEKKQEKKVEHKVEIRVEKKEDTPVKKVEVKDPVKEEVTEEATEKKERVIVNPENIDEILEKTKTFLDDLFKAMKIETKVEISFDKEKNDINIELSGEEMGVLIGKRGNTLDSLQYLTSLYCNRLSDAYLRVKMDTENYRARRKQTLEHLAKNIAYKVKKTRRPVYLEPMNPYERRIIHSALQNDRFVTTKSEGEEPYRKVVVLLKK